MHAPSTPARPPIGLVVLLGLLTAFGAVSIDLYLPALPAIAAHFGVPVGASQVTMSAFLLGMAVGQLGFGPLSDRIGRKPPLLAGAAIYTVASLALVFAPSIEWLTAGRFLQAIGACAGVVIARAVVRDRFDTTESARLFSFMFLVFGVVPMVAPALGTVLLAAFGWQSLFVVLAGFGLISGLAVLFGLKESRTAATADLAASESAWGSYLAALADRRVLGFVLAGALNGAALFAYIAASPALFVQYYGQSPGEFSGIFAINAFGLIAATQLNRYILTRMGPEAVVRVATLTALGFALLLLVLSVAGLATMPVAIVLIFLSLSSFGFVGGNSSALALGVMPARAGAISALIGAGSFVVGALASALTAPFAEQGPVAMAAGMTLGFAGSALALYRLAGVGRWSS